MWNDTQETISTVALTRVATVTHQCCQEGPFFLQKSLTAEPVAAVCLWRALDSCSSITQSAKTVKNSGWYC